MDGSPDVDSVQNVTEWLSKAGDAHFGQSSRLYSTAINRLMATLTEGEPPTVRWALDNLPVLGKRLALKEPALDPNSVAVYVSRARRGLESYVSWKKSPVGWAPERSRTGAASSRESAKPTRVKTRVGDLAPEPPENIPQTLESQASELLKIAGRFPHFKNKIILMVSAALQDSVKAD